MKNKYLIIHHSGEIFSPEEYVNHSDCSDKFRILIEREVFGKGVERSINENIKPQYLNYARKLGFDWEPNSPSGFMQNDYRAELIMRLVKEYSRQVVHKMGLPILEVRGANMFDLEHPVVESYANLYGDRLFHPNVGGKKSVMSYDASYPQFNLASKYNLSYKHFPFAHFSISDCYRQEQSGECMLFYRLRRFFMPDLHPYFLDVDQAFEWYPKIEREIIQSAKDVNREYEVIVAVSSINDWEKYKRKIIEISLNNQKDVLVSIHQDNIPKYWIINVDYNIIDNLGQVREISCIQIDVGNANRLGIEYKDMDGEIKNPIIIHSAGIGGIERYLYMLFDQFKESFPIWLYPIQLRLIPVGEKYVESCSELAKEFRHCVRIDIDDRSESVGKRIKFAHKELIPNILVMGENEFSQNNGLEKFNLLIEQIQNGCKDYPFLPVEWPQLVSQQVRCQ